MLLIDLAGTKCHRSKSIKIIFRETNVRKSSSYVHQSVSFSKQLLRMQVQCDVIVSFVLLLLFTWHMCIERFCDVAVMMLASLL